METFNQGSKKKLVFLTIKIIALRYELIKEELNELKEAINKKDLKSQML